MLMRTHSPALTAALPRAASQILARINLSSISQLHGSFASYR